MLLVIDLSLVIEDPKSYQLFLINLVLSIVKCFFQLTYGGAVYSQLTLAPLWMTPH